LQAQRVFSKDPELSKSAVISVIDDDASIRTALDNLLQSLGYAVHTFGSAQEFLQSGHLDDTVCVISDVNMPETNGVELFTIVRQGGSQVPFIFITAFPEEKISKQARRVGAAFFLTKPFKRDELVRCIEEALRGGSEPHR
jgi:FixJ family two-component response regulator